MAVKKNTENINIEELVGLLALSDDELLAVVNSDTESAFKSICESVAKKANVLEIDGDFARFVAVAIDDEEDKSFVTTNIFKTLLATVYKNTSTVATSDTSPATYLPSGSEDETYLSEMVELKLPLTRDNADDEFVAVNGKAYQIKRGEVVRVPRCIAQVLADREQQEEQAIKAIRQAENSFKNLDTK